MELICCNISFHIRHVPTRRRTGREAMNNKRNRKNKNKNKNKAAAPPATQPEEEGLVLWNLILLK